MTAVDNALTELRMRGPDYDLIDAWGIDETLECIGLPQIVRWLRESGGYVVTQPRAVNCEQPTAPDDHERE